MNNKDLEDMINADLAIDQTRLQAEAAENAVKHFKYISMLSTAKIELKKAENDLKRVRRERYLYLIGKHPDKVSPEIFEKSEIKTVLEGDPDLLRAESRVSLHKTRVETLNMVCDVFKSRNFSIKNIIEQRILESGR